MKLLTILKDVIKENSENKSAEQISDIIEQVIDGALEETIRKTRIPKPPGAIEIAIEDLRYAHRRSKHYKKTHKRIDYALWYALYNAKLELSDRGETSISTMDFGIDFTTNFGFTHEPSSDITSMIPDVALSDGSEVIDSSNLIYFDVSSDMESRILQDSTVSVFVSCIEEICRKSNLELTTPAKFSLEQKKDLEMPTWNKIILNVKFKKLTLEESIREWEKLRMLIDNSLDLLVDDEDIDKKKLKELRNEFYIKLIP